MSGSYTLSMSKPQQSVNGSYRSNRGPAAAAENHEAIIDAARTLFETTGVNVPMRAIAQRAQVSQGVLYRHFPNRTALAVAVFEHNFETIEAIASTHGPGTCARLWDWLLGCAVMDVGFVEVTVAARSEYDGQNRFLSLLNPCIDEAIKEGAVPRGFTPYHLVAGWRMAYGVAVTTPDKEKCLEFLRRTLTLPNLVELLRGEFEASPNS